MTAAPSAAGGRRVAACLALAALTAWGLALRSAGIRDQSLWIDEGFSIIGARAVLEHGYPLLDSGKVYTNQMGAVYLIAASIKAFGFDPWHPWAARLPAVAFGAGLIPLAYLWMRRLLKSRSMAAVVAAVIALSQWEIAWSAQARGYVMLQFFLLACLHFAWRWFEDGRRADLAAALGLAALACWSHMLAVLYLVPAALFWAVDRRLSPRRAAQAVGAAVSLSAAWMALLVVLSRDGAPVGHVAYLYFLATEKTALLAGAALGAILVASDAGDRRPLLFLLLNAVIPLAGLMHAGAYNNMRYIFALFPLLAALAVYGLSRLIALAKVPDAYWLRSLALAALTGLLLLHHLQFRPAARNVLEFDSPQPDFSAAYRRIRDLRGPDDIVISPYTPLTSLYLGEKGYWLPISLTGLPAELKALIVDGVREFYVGAPIVASPEDFQATLERRHGFVVMDRMAFNRLPAFLPILNSHRGTALVHRSGSGMEEVGVIRF